MGSTMIMQQVWCSNYGRSAVTENLSGTGCTSDGTSEHRYNT